jgi:4-amino-4-deoxy-L-arabinose transferase-like glycosyltransferase
MSRAAWLYPLVVIAAGLLSYLPWLGSYGLLDPTDSFFLESGRELIETNQFLLPLNNYVPWLDKPILFFWMVAGAFKCLGISAFSGRLPAALSAVACALIIYSGCRPFLKRNTALLASLIFLSMPLSSVVGHLCLTDMTLCALIAGSLLSLFKGLEFGSCRNLWLGYLFLALAMLCKGPIAVVICGLSILPCLFLIAGSRSKFFEMLLDLKPVYGAAIVLAVNLPWYVLASIATHGEFLSAFFLTQNFGRMVGTVNHQEPFYFYIQVFFGGFFPWSLTGLSAPGLVKRTFVGRTCASSRYCRFFALSLFWFGSVIVLFTAIKTKLPTYILPACPAFAILAAMQLEALCRAGKLRRLAAVTAIITVAVVVAAAIHPHLKGYVRDVIGQNIWVLAPMSILLAVSWYGLVRRNARTYVLSLLACVLLGCGVMVPRGMLAFFDYKQRGFNELACRARDDGASIAMIHAEEPSVCWFTHRPVARLKERQDAEKFLAGMPAPHYVLVQKKLLSDMKWFACPQVLIAESNKWQLIKVQAAPPGGREEPPAE